MTNQEIVQALRCCAKGLGHDDACENCKVGEIQDRREYIEFAAANLIERLTAGCEMMKGASNFDKLCHQVYNADGNGRDYIGKATGATCRLCKSPLYAYYCEERVYLVECKTCEMKALVKAENPQVAAYRALGIEVN